MPVLDATRYTRAFTKARRRLLAELRWPRSPLRPRRSPVRWRPARPARTRRRARRPGPCPAGRRRPCRRPRPSRREPGRRREPPFRSSERRRRATPCPPRSTPARPRPSPASSSDRRPGPSGRARGRRPAAAARTHARNLANPVAGAVRRHRSRALRMSATSRSSLCRSSSSASTRRGSSPGRRAALRRLAQARFFPGDVLDRGSARHGLDPADAGADRAFGDDLEEADIAGAAHVGAAAEFDRIGRTVAREPMRRRGPRRRTSRRTAPWRPLRRPAPASSAGSTGRSRGSARSPRPRSRRGRPASSACGWLTSKRSRSGATSEPFCATWVPRPRRSASCRRCVAEWWPRIAAAA